MEWFETSRDWFVYSLPGHLRDARDGVREWVLTRGLRWWWKLRLKSRSPGSRMRAAIILSKRDCYSGFSDLIKQQFRELTDPNAARILAKCLLRGDVFAYSVRSEAKHVPSACLVDSLSESLSDRRTSTRLAAARALRLIEDPRAIEPLARALVDADPWVRLEAVRELAKHANPLRKERMLAAARDADSLVREYAVQGLKTEQGPEVVEALATAMHDDNVGVQWNAIDTLGHHEGQRALDLLQEALTLSSVHSRTRAIESISRHKAASLLVRGTRDGSPEVRTAAAGALAEYDTDEAVAALAELLGDRDSEVARLAGEILERRSDRTRNPTLESFLGHPDERVSGEVARLMGSRARPGALTPLLRELTSGEKLKRIAALKQMAGWNDARARAPLAACLADPDPDIRKQAIPAIGDSQISEVVPLLADPCAEVRQEAAVALGKRGDSRGIDYLLRDARQNLTGPALHRLAETGQPQVLDPLLEALHDPSAVMRLSAVRALEKLRDRRSASALRSIRTHDEDIEVRLAAREALWTVLPSYENQTTEERAIMDELLAGDTSTASQPLDPFAPCPTCHGSGRIKYVDHWQKCPDCVGPTPYRGMKS